MPATENTQTGPNGHRSGGRGGRSQSGTAPHGPPDAGVLAREAVITFLQDASKVTAEREAGRAGAAAAEAEAEASAAADSAKTAVEVPEPAAMPGDTFSAASPVAAQSEAWRLAAVSAAALDRIEAAAAKVEADIAVAHRRYEELKAGAGDAAEAAVHAAHSALASASTAVEAERQVKIGLRLVRQNVLITTVLVAVVIIILVVISTPLG
jgi:hypothetical protein